MASSSINLRAARKDLSSQHGEDGMIERIFEIMGVENKWCVELGALNGTHDSNTRSLIKDKGWSGVLIEADTTYFAKLQELYADATGVHTVNAFVTFSDDSTLDAILAKTALPKEFDLFSLDIDGNEYHVWESLTNYHPRLLVVEFNPTIPSDISFIQPRDMSVFQGSSALAFVTLGKQKGYELIATNETNAFFVRKEVFPLFGIEDNSLSSLRVDRQFETRLFQLYDGTLKLVGNQTLLWHKLPIREEDIQILPKWKRQYPARISGSGLVRSIKYWARRMPFYTIIQKLRYARRS